MVKSRRKWRRRSTRRWRKCAARSERRRAARICGWIAAHRECAAGGARPGRWCCSPARRSCCAISSTPVSPGPIRCMRSLVLWTGMLGALAAVRDDKHIALDVLQRFLSAESATRRRASSRCGFAAIVCAVVAYYCYADARDRSRRIDASRRCHRECPRWLPESILPIAIRFDGAAIRAARVRAAAHAAGAAARSG